MRSIVREDCAASLTIEYIKALTCLRNKDNQNARKFMRDGLGIISNEDERNAHNLLMADSYHQEHRIDDALDTLSRCSAQTATLTHLKCLQMQIKLGQEKVRNMMKDLNKQDLKDDVRLAAAYKPVFDYLQNDESTDSTIEKINTGTQTESVFRTDPIHSQKLLEQELARVTDQYTELKKNLDDMCNVQQYVVDDKEKAEQDLVTKTTLYDQEIQALKENLNKVELLRAQTEDRYNKLETEKHKEARFHKKELDSARKESLAKQTGLHNEQIKELTKKLGSSESSRTSAEALNKSLAMENSQLLDNNKGHISELEQLNTQLAEKDSKRKKMNANIDQITTELKGVSNTIETIKQQHQKDIEQKEGEKSELKQKIKKLKQSQTDNTLEQLQLTNQIDEQNIRVAKLNADISTAKISLVAISGSEASFDLDTTDLAQVTAHFNQAMKKKEAYIAQQEQDHKTAVEAIRVDLIDVSASECKKVENRFQQQVNDLQNSHANQLMQQRVKSNTEKATLEQKIKQLQAQNRALIERVKSNNNETSPPEDRDEGEASTTSAPLAAPDTVNTPDDQGLRIK